MGWDPYLLVKCIQFPIDYHRALKLGEVDVAYGRVVLIGEPGAGKSSLLRAMMNQAPMMVAESTVMADTKEIKNEVEKVAPHEVCMKKSDGTLEWKKTSMNTAQYWCDLTEEDELKEMAILASKVINEPRRLLEKIEDAFAVTVFRNAKFEQSEHKNDTAFEEEINAVYSDITQRVKGMLKSELPESDQYLNVWDCGGQRVFLDVLTPFLTSRTMFVIVFDASNDLNKRVPMVWNHEGKSKIIETLNITRKDLLLQWMSCISACLSEKAEKYFKAQCSKVHLCLCEAECKCTTCKYNESQIPPYPRIIVVGTHSDMLVNEKKVQIIQMLDSENEGKPFSDQVEQTILLDSTRRGEHEDPEIKIVIQTVTNFVNAALRIPTPLAWVLFRKLLTRVAKDKPVLSVERVALIADKCSINNAVLFSVLSFYHELGTFLHYKEINLLKDVVITQPEWLVKHLGKLIASGSGRSVGPREAWHQLCKRGILVEPLYQEVWKTDGIIVPQAFADLLEHFNLIGKLNTSAARMYKGMQYFMPLMLPVSKNDYNHNLQDSAYTAAPLHITFSSTYVPPGFFVRLATLLSTTANFTIIFHQSMYSDQIVFQYSEDEGINTIDDIAIVALQSSIRVDIARRSPCTDITKHHFPAVCHSVMIRLLGVIHDLQQWFKSIDIQPAFECKCSGGPPHFYTISPTDDATKSYRCRSNNIVNLDPDQQLWAKIPDIKVN